MAYGRIRSATALVAGFLAFSAPFLLSLAVSTTDVRIAAAASSDASSALEKLAIDTRSGRHVFRVELAVTDAELERGLMYRRSLPTDRGMLFNFQTPQVVQMWMKNTYIPLDMIFIARDGSVTHIAKNAEPLSESIISSEGEAYAVLEVNAGTADKLGLVTGDRIENQIFAH